MALWTTGDGQIAERRNREAIIGRMGLPVYDTNGANTVTATPIRRSLALTTSLTTVWTVPTSSVTLAHLTTITICNTDAVAQTASVYLVEPGQTAASVARTLFNDSLLAGERIQIRVPYFLAPNALIRAFSSANNVVALRVDALTYDSQPAGMTLKIIEGVALTTTATTYYTVPGSGVTHAILLATTFCNTDTTARQPRLYLVFSGDTRALSHQIWHDTLQPKETVWLAGAEIMMPGDKLDAVASAGALLSMRPTIVEFT